MMADNNEMIMEYGQQAAAVRDEQLVEMQSTIDELDCQFVAQGQPHCYQGRCEP